MRFILPILALLNVVAAVRVMPLGDSITGSPGCWRATLYNRLVSSGFKDINMVGTLSGQDCGVAYDGNHEGHGGFLVTNVAKENLLPGWLANTNPDIVIMHFSTNDVWNAIAPSQIFQAWSTLLQQMRSKNRRVTLIVAKMIPLSPREFDCPGCPQRAVDFNNMIPAWAAKESKVTSRVYVVDQWTGFDVQADTYDGVHPNTSGDNKMAANWYKALEPVLRARKRS